MAEQKIKKTRKSPKKFILSIDNNIRRNDALKLLELYETWTGFPPRIWGESIVGYGDYHYKYASGREGDWFYVGFGARKANLSIYTNLSVEQNQPFLEKLGPYKSGASCIYIKKLDVIDLKVLEQMVKHAVNVLGGEVRASSVLHLL